MTLNDPDRWDAMGQIFLVDHRYYRRVIRPRMTKFGTETRVMGKHVSRGQPRLHPKGSEAPASPKFLEPLQISLVKQASFVPGAHARL